MLYRNARINVKKLKMQLRLIQFTHFFCFIIGCSFTILIMSYNLRDNGMAEVFEKRTVDVLVLILSAPKNLEQRSAIRKTWVKDLQIQYIYMFVIGSQDLSHQNRKIILSEQSTFSDILLLPVHDSYFNLTRKLLAALINVFQTHKFAYLLKVDDDTFVNVNLLNGAIMSVDNSKPVYWGYFNGRAPVFKNGKWKEDDWFLCDRYLPYAVGGGYILSYSAIEFIAQNAHLLSIYKAEDVSLGTWLGGLNISRVHDIRFDTGHVSRGCSNSHIVTHKQSPSNMLDMQLSLTTNGVPCLIEKVIHQPYVYDWSLPPTKCCSKLHT